jgi:hypothetical protein
VTAFNEQNFAHQPMLLIEGASKFIDDERLDQLEQFGRLTTAHAISVQPDKIKDIEQFNWALNPYAHEKAVQAGLNAMSLETAQTLHQLMSLGLLPEYVEQYVDMATVKAIAQWTS